MTNTDGQFLSMEIKLGPCPRCGAMGVVEGEPQRASGSWGTAIAATPATLASMLRELAAGLESGQMSRDDALERLRADERLHPLLEWVEDRGASLTILVSVLLALAGFVAAQATGNDGLTPEQVGQIVKSVADKHDDPLATEDSEAPSAGETRGSAMRQADSGRGRGMGESTLDEK